MMPVILANDALRAQLPQARVVVAARGHQVRAVGAERAVPDPALVRAQVRLEWEWERGRGLR